MVNTSNQSKLEDSSAVAPTSERNQLQTSQDSSIKVKEKNLNTDKSDTPKTVVQPTSFNDENNLRDPDSKDVEVKPKESSNVDTNEQKETSTALSKQPANADTQLAATTSGVQPFVNLAVESDNNDLTPKHETIDSQWTIHYVNQADHKQELKDPTVITMQYTRTNTPQSNGKIQYGDWSYVPDSFKQTGTPITVKDSNNPVKQDNVDKNGENFDVFTITAMYPTVAGYNFYNGINGTRLHDNLRNNERQADSMSKDFYAEYDVAKPTQETVGSQWRIHYIDSTNHEHELKAPTVITMQYTRINTPQSDGTIQHGDWSYVPGSFKLTGTPITVNDSNNPVKQDNVDNNGKNEDVFTITAMYPTITGYNFHDGINNSRLHAHLLNYDPIGSIQMPTMGQDFDVEYDPIGERSVAVKFVDDQSYDFHTSDHKKQVGQAITLTGHNGDTVNLKLTVPDKYQLADGQQLPTTYTFAKGSGDLKIHLVHKVVQREATINVQLGLATLVRTRGDDGDDAVQKVVTQTQWKQWGDGLNIRSVFGVSPLVEVGTLTGHVDYDLVDETVVSLKNDWTSLNLSGHSYKLPNGTEVVNGIRIDSSDTIGKKLRDDWYLNEYRKRHSDVDPDYITRPWYGYLSVNETNNESNSDYGIMSNVRELGLQAGLVGDEPNALAKAAGDRAATAVEMSNKPIDFDLLQNYDFDFSEQNGQLRAKVSIPLAGVYVPYVEKTATRTINVTTPDGKTTAVKQTATLAKQVDFGKDAHPTWTTGEWANYDVPTIPGYTASQSQIAKTAVTGTTEDQTVNITYTANNGTQTIVYQDEDGSEIDKQVISGKTDEKVKVTSDVPDGYVLKGEIPSEVTIKPDDTPITVTVEHGKSHVTPDKPVNKGDLIPGTKDKHYPEGLTHDDLNKTITREITIIDPIGKKSTTAQTVTFTRGATVDEVTNKVTYDDWSENGKHTFDKVDVPTVLGYTVSGEVPEVVVTPETQSSKVNITYTANTQHMMITYVDDTTGKKLHTDKLDGVSDQDAKYTTGDIIKQYEDQHYKLVSDSTNGKELIFDHDDNADQTYEVHFVHGSHTINQTTSPKQTIHYVYADGLARQGQAADDNVQQLSFKRDGYNDEVTGTDHWNAWTPANSNYSAVDSPVVQGYTPDKSVIEKSTVNPTDKDTEITVVYNADKQAARVIYVDKTTNATLTSNNLSGKSDKDSGYNTKDTIEKYQSQHYVLTKDETKGKNVIFDHDDKQDQTYYVYFVHGTQKVNRQDTVTSTIDYKFEDGKTAQPTVTQTKHFSEDGVKDKVTGQITWTPADSQKFDDAITPVITGYTPDKNSVAGSTVNFGDSDIVETVTYHNNVQTAKITYIDDTAKKTLDSDTQNGKFNYVITFEHDPANVIKGLEAKGYKLVSNDFNNNNYQADNSKNVFYVHFVHGSHDISDKKAITETITYKMSDGSKAPDQVEKQVEFSRVGKHDEVTNTDTWNKWQPNKQSFDAVPTPDVTGYTPDIKSVEAKIVTAGDKDITVNVTYTPDKQKAKVVFIDDTAKKTLDTHDLTGVTNSHEKYSPSEEIEKFIHDNYVFVSSDYPEKGFTYDNDDNYDQVFEVHLKEIPTESDTPIVPGNTEDNGGSNDTPTDSDNPEKDNGGSDTVDKSNHKTPVKRNSNEKHHGIKKITNHKNANRKHQGTKYTNIHKTSKTAKLNPNEANTKANKLTQTKLGKTKESTNDTLPQTGNKQSGLMAALGLAISSLGMIGAVKSKKRKDNE